MRLVTYRGEAGERAGVDTDDGVFDAAALLGEQSASVRGLIAQDRVGELRERLESGIGAIDPIPAPELLPPITDPEKIVCIGLNYRSHAAEAGIDPPADPTFFAKFRNALASPGATVKLPAASEKVDYEAEIAFVVGRRCKEIGSGDALDAIAGYTLLNDLSARDLQFATPQWMPGKVFDGSAPCGPALVTPDEAGPADRISFALDLNGERMQEASTSDLIFPVAELVARLSRWMTLEPGDIVSTGTPAGSGQCPQAESVAEGGGRDLDHLADARRAANDGQVAGAGRLAPTRSAPRPAARSAGRRPGRPSSAASPRSGGG